MSICRHFNRFVPLHAHSVFIFSNLHFNYSLDILVYRTVCINVVLKSLKLAIESENALVKVTYSLYDLFEVHLGVGKPVI